MTVAWPKLDNKSYDELVADARSLIPLYAPGWTDHNAHDPGITLMELLAFLVEINHYRLDRVSQEAYRTFLRLTGVEPRPLQAAETMLVFKNAMDGPLQLPVGLQIGNSGANVVFELAENVTVTPANLKKVLATSGGKMLDLTLQNEEGKSAFRPLGENPAPGDCLYLGFDKPLATNRTPIRLYLWTTTPDDDAALRRKFLSDASAKGHESSDKSLGMTPHRLNDWRRHYWAETVWEYYSVLDKWKRLDPIVDETRALTMSGAIKFISPSSTPESPAQQIGGVLGAAEDVYFIRCKLKSGGYELAPDILQVAINAAKAHHAAAAKLIKLTSSGCAGQTVSLPGSPVVPKSTIVTIHGNAEDSGEWIEHLFWETIGPHDKGYVLDPEKGMLLFGDGRHGKVPGTNAEISVSYKTGGGEAGNVSSDTLVIALPNSHNQGIVNDWASLRENLAVEQPFAAFGGAEAESLDNAKARAIELVSLTQRGVTLGDFETLAKAVPGVKVARVLALADYDPQLPSIPAAGCVTVVIVPQSLSSKPMPSNGMLGAITCFLNTRRIITTRIEVVAPEYTVVGVKAQLKIENSTDSAATVQQAKEAVAAFFHPLTGGPQGGGWPIGRNVYRAEILALLNSLQGVASAESMVLSCDGEAASACDNIVICRHGLVEVGTIEITLSNDKETCAPARQSNSESPNLSGQQKASNNRPCSC